MTDEEGILLLHTASGLTHNHIRAKIACGLYYFCVRALLDCEGSLSERLQTGVDQGMAFYREHLDDVRELYQYNRIRRLSSLKDIPEPEIYSGGYVVATMTAALWCLLQTDSYEACELLAVNLGHDTDTVAAVWLRSMVPLLASTAMKQSAGQRSHCPGLWQVS